MLANLPILSSFLAVLAPLRPCFPRARTFENFVAVIFGWVMAQATGTLSSALVAGDLVDKKHWSAFYRLFSRATWCIDRLGLAVADLLVARFAPTGPIDAAVDDTLHARGGPHVFGAGMHHDPLTLGAAPTSSERACTTTRSRRPAAGRSSSSATAGSPSPSSCNSRSPGGPGHFRCSSGSTCPRRWPASGAYPTARRPSSLPTS
ncbi:MAG: transposase [Acidobacteria bacterium]|nr:transposase [Acidobacteriota bacterium]